jgi:hypothetical protein
MSSKLGLVDGPWSGPLGCLAQRVAHVAPPVPSGAAVIPGRPGRRWCSDPRARVAGDPHRAEQRDDLLTREHEDELARAIPDFQLVTYHDTGHLVLWEQPDRIAADMTSFLARLSQESH